MEKPTKHITDTDAKEFLEGHSSGAVEQLVHIQEGKHSDAFSYVYGDQDFVVRFNVTDEGFLKDKYAYEHFSSEGILIPKILEIGKYSEEVFYCISEKVAGETAKEQYGKQNFNSLPAQFQTIEEIAQTSVLAGGGFGKWNGEGKTESDFDTYFSEICTGGISDWSVFDGVSYFDKNFAEYLLAQAKKYSSYSAHVRVLVHGDFGGSNLIMNGDKVSGVIDWAHSFYGDHFWDVGRVVLFCPNRNETTRASLEFYKDKYTNYKERIAWGVYRVMLKNYAVALQSGQETSCRSSEGRIKEIEEVLNL